MNVHDELTFSKLGDEAIEMKYKNLSVIKDGFGNYIYIQSIEQLVSKLLHRQIHLQSYITSYLFYEQLCIIDKTLQKHGNVYLLMNTETKTFDIGRTYDISKRYNKLKREEIVRVVPVLDDVAIESKLIKYFSSHYQKAITNRVPGAKTNETFIYSNYEQTIKEFDKLMPKKKLELDYQSSTHLYIDMQKQSLRGLWCSLSVFKIITNHYINDKKQREIIDEFINGIKVMIKNDTFIYYEYNKQLKTKCLYWKYHKYTVIQNENDGYVNGSRLWNSIKKTDDLKVGISLNRFLHSKRIENLRGNFEEMFPGKQMYTEKLINSEQPWFSGIYVHYAIIHFIVEYLDAKYAIIVAALMYKRYRDEYEKEEKRIESFSEIDFTQLRNSERRFRSINDMLERYDSLNEF